MEELLPDRQFRLSDSARCTSHSHRGQAETLTAAIHELSKAISGDNNPNRVN